MFPVLNYRVLTDLKVLEDIPEETAVMELTYETLKKRSYITR